MDLNSYDGKAVYVEHVANGTLSGETGVVMSGRLYSVDVNLYPTTVVLNEIPVDDVLEISELDDLATPSGIEQAVLVAIRHMQTAAVVALPLEIRD